MSEHESQSPFDSDQLLQVGSVSIWLDTTAPVPLHRLSKSVYRDLQAGKLIDKDLKLQKLG